ncbi:MAG: hypothetical protein NUV56_04580 [Candidatus Uhrbacteria bacterium]|nr:hypothetical protein [Candidatus Uhrbacteria bacterium]
MFDALSLLAVHTNRKETIRQANLAWAEICSPLSRNIPSELASFVDYVQGTMVKGERLTFFDWMSKLTEHTSEGQFHMVQLSPADLPRWGFDNLASLRAAMVELQRAWNDVITVIPQVLMPELSLRRLPITIPDA